MLFMAMAVPKDASRIAVVLSHAYVEKVVRALR
jgi:hypothetical protein